MNTLCAAVMENDSGHEPLCTKPEKAVDILRQEGSSWRTRQRLEKSWPTQDRTRSKVRTICRLMHEVFAILLLGAIDNTMVDVVICASLDTEHLSKSLDGEVEHRE